MRVKGILTEAALLLLEAIADERRYSRVPRDNLVAVNGRDRVTRTYTCLRDIMRPCRAVVSLLQQVLRGMLAKPTSRI